jgi:hypothetical protein
MIKNDFKIIAKPPIGATRLEDRYPGQYILSFVNIRGSVSPTVFDKLRLTNSTEILLAINHKKWYVGFNNNNKAIEGYRIQIVINVKTKSYFFNAKRFKDMGFKDGVYKVNIISNPIIKQGIKWYNLVKL